MFIFELRLIIYQCISQSGIYYSKHIRVHIQTRNVTYFNSIFNNVPSLIASMQLCFSNHNLRTCNNQDELSDAPVSVHVHGMKVHNMRIYYQNLYSLINLRCVERNCKWCTCAYESASHTTARTGDQLIVKVAPSTRDYARLEPQRPRRVASKVVREWRTRRLLETILRNGWYGGR